MKNCNTRYTSVNVSNTSPPSPQGGAAESGATPMDVPVPKRPPKRKRDPKKLRMGGGSVWEDHSLDDWDHGEGEGRGRGASW